MARIYVDKDSGRIERTDMYLVKLTLNDGTVIEDLEPRRLFPHTDTDHYISLLNKKEKEIALVKDIKELDEASRKALEECFKEYYLIPKISQVLHVEDKFGALSFRVMTDRGEISFRIRNRHSDIKMLHKDGRILIRDSDDNRYEIPCYNDLDRHSKHLLFSYV
ncbi:MAG: DUF1854 domain-containing protein [Clostridia bacterium]|nr:DUF1854 domain-containing protein [Clostridia bacterium]